MLEKLIKWFCVDNSLVRVVRVSGLLWAISLISFFAIVVYVIGIRQRLFDQVSGIYTLLLLGFLLLGATSFLVGGFGFIILNFTKHHKQNGFLLLMKAALLFAIFPIYLLLYIIKPLALIRLLRSSGIKGVFSSSNLSKNRLGVKIAALLTVLLVILPVWIGGVVGGGSMIAYSIGYVEEQGLVPGTGSMYPTFPKGTKKTPKEQYEEIVGSYNAQRYPSGLEIFGNRFFGHEIQRGDIVTFENDKTREITQETFGVATGFLKRVIAMPGDTLEIREGMVILNGQPQKEPYIAKARSTFGGGFLSDCRLTTVPDGKVFVMGDNRKGSGDSRHDLGFVDLSDIDHVIPWSKQFGVLDKKWRDTSRDLEESSKIRIDKTKFLELLDEKRKEVGARPLKYQTRLEQSAIKRGEVILKFDDYSFEATRSGYTMQRAMNEVGYSNISWGEAPAQGYYEAEELIENQFEFPEFKKFLLDKDFQEIGIAEVEREINGCPTQVIVQHLAGYVPPNYKSEDLQAWRDVLNNLNSVISSWEAAKGNRSVNQDDLKKLLDLFYREKEIASRMISRMEKNQWLTKEEEGMISEYNRLMQQSIDLGEKLNGQ